jgi:ryanodine receptor 2
MNYIPKPIDTSAVKLPDDLRELTERLAENTHDVWARRKLADGWTWGSTIDAIGKKHPDLIPYDQLPEHKKDYDRDTAMETIKAILSLGYTIARSHTSGSTKRY